MPLAISKALLSSSSRVAMLYAIRWSSGLSQPMRNTGEKRGHHALEMSRNPDDLTAHCT